MALLKNYSVALTAIDPFLLMLAKISFYCL